MTDVIVTNDLSKTFVVRRKTGVLRRERVEVAAVCGVNVHVAPGEMVGFIGPNGAGKSTTIKMLSGVLQPSGGNARVLGLTPLDDRVKLARRIGVVFGQRSQLWWDLPLADSFSLLRHMYRVSAADHRDTLTWLSDLLELGPLMSVAVRQLSLGQRMRGELAAALLHRPELVFLDEPTIGLDVVSKHAVREALEQLNRDQGTTVILTTHDLKDIERLCERVVIIDHGRVIIDGPLAAVVERLDSTRILVVDLDKVYPAMQLDGVECQRVEGSRQWLGFDGTKRSATDVLGALAAVADVRDISLEEPDIDAIVRRIYAGG